MTVCGTGSGNFPQPGDPDLNSQILSAQTVYGGIQVSWTYPGLLPEAVAHIRLYRGTTSVFANATLLQPAVTGSAYFDRADTLGTTTTYYYWIQIVSVNGTIGDTIGPASAVMSPNIADLAAKLVGYISDSELSAALKTKIDAVDGFNTLLNNESGSRLIAEGLLANLIAVVQADLLNIDALVLNEITTRITQDSALASQISAVIATVNGNTAAVLTESLARVTADTAFAGQLTLITADIGTNTADILTESTARATADGAIAQTITTLGTTVGGNTASISASAIVENGLTSQWMVKTSVGTSGNEFISGFGLYSTGASSDFIGHTTKYPFAVGLVDGVSVISMDAAVWIKDASIDTVSIGLAAVDSLQIAGEAVIVADGVNNDPALALTTGFQTIATKTVTFSGVAPVAVMVTGFGNFQTTSVPSSVFDVVMQITANGSAGGVVSQTHDGGTGGGTAVMASCQKYTGLTGTVVFNLQMKKNGATGTILGRNSGLIIQGVKR